jgi:hypothetical protein
MTTSKLDKPNDLDKPKKEFLPRVFFSGGKNSSLYHSVYAVATVHPAEHLPHDVEFLSLDEANHLVNEAMAGVWLAAARACDFRETTAELKPKFVEKYEELRNKE